jgi:hypothetical protein
MGPTSRGLLLRGVGGSRTSVALPFGLGNHESHVALPFDVLRGKVEKDVEFVFTLDGPASLSVEMPFAILGRTEAHVEMPFAILDGMTGVDDGAIIAPLIGWWDPEPPVVLGYRDLIVSTPGILGYWRLGEASGDALDALDIAALTPTGSPTRGAPGALLADPDGAVSLNGSSQYLTRASMSHLHPGDVFSLVLWFRRTATGARDLWCTGTGDVEVGFDASHRPFAAKVGTGNWFTTATTVAADATWHMLAVTKDGPARAMYLDGAALTNSASDQTLVAGTAAPFVGRHGPSATAYWQGGIDEVSLFERALSAAEVAALFARARGTA